MHHSTVAVSIMSMILIGLGACHTNKTETEQAVVEQLAITQAIYEELVPSSTEAIKLISSIDSLTTANQQIPERISIHLQNLKIVLNKLEEWKINHLEPEYPYDSTDLYLVMKEQGQLNEISDQLHQILDASKLHLKK